MTKPLCLITGVGETTGESITKRFVQGGYRVAMVARNTHRLDCLEIGIPGTRAFPCDIGNINALKKCIATIQADLGNPRVVIHNAVSATFDRFLDGNPGDLERNFRVNTTVLLYMARAFAPAMIDAGSGAILVTASTADLRGIPTYALFAPHQGGTAHSCTCARA